jgi:hypothetical protein
MRQGTRATLEIVGFKFRENSEVLSEMLRPLYG